MSNPRTQLQDAREAIGEAWFVGGVTPAEAIRRKTRALEALIEKSTGIAPDVAPLLEWRGLRIRDAGNGTSAWGHARVSVSVELHSGEWTAFITSRGMVSRGCGKAAVEALDEALAEAEPQLREALVNAAADAARSEFG